MRSGALRAPFEKAPLPVLFVITLKTLKKVCLLRVEASEGAPTSERLPNHT